MKSPSVLRSLVFWSGLLVMGFIIWAWCDSTRSSTTVAAGPWELESWASGVAVKYQPDLEGSWTLSRGPRERAHRVSMLDPSYEVHALKSPVAVALETFRFGRPGLEDLAEAKGYIPAGVSYGTRGITGAPEPVMDLALRDHYLGSRPLFSPGPVSGWIGFLPHWLLLVMASVLWSGLVAWQAWRWRRRDPASYEEYRSRKYPWGRSPVFWCGLAVLVFTLWLWCDSTYQGTRVEVDDLGVQSWASAVIVMKHQGTTVPWQAGHTPHYRPNEVALGEMRFAKPGVLGIRALESKRRMPGPRPLSAGPGEDPGLRGFCAYLQRSEPARLGWGAWIVFIPHWLILLAEAAIWGGLLAWRARRWQRGREQKPVAGAVEAAGTPEEAVAS